MDNGVKIPVRVARPGWDQPAPGTPASGPSTHGDKPAIDVGHWDRDAVREKRVDTASNRAYDSLAYGSEVGEWRDRALRLRADMENFRRRQQRLSENSVIAERERLLVAFLQIVDDLERALSGSAGSTDSIREGLQLTHRSARNMLEKEGVQPVAARGLPFDPNWHDAIATVGRDGSDASPNTVVSVVEPGYRLGDKLLRPAKVVVAL